MGNLPNLWYENRSETTTTRFKNQDSITIKLSCADFGTFNGCSDQWISFKENTLSKAGVGSYAQYIKLDFTHLFLDSIIDPKFEGTVANC
jgi:hypothetical protein